ncbi:MAG: cytochrome c peroxidase [Verrucomicrobiota bacterium]
MKAHLPRLSFGVFAAWTAFVAMPAARAAVPPPPDASLAIVTAGPGGVRVKISDAANRVWLLQSTTNFANWSDSATVKIYNGSFQSRFTAGESTPGVFFRAYFDPARQDIFSGIESALRLPVDVFNYASPLLPPSFLVQPILGQDNMPANNVTSDPGATLGRVLFYDKRLSTNLTISCSSCHQRDHGFSDPRRFSTGFNGGLTGRNSMGLSNARWYQRRHFFWDERANTLEDQVLQPIQNPVEMGMTLGALPNRLAAEAYYTNLFAHAFGSPTVTSDRISAALAQFVRSIISTHSKYDAGAGRGFTNFTAEENLGRQIFLGQVGNATCAACHGTDNFVPGPGINNNGLENPYVDKGLGGITGRVQDEGLFKVPSLRNIQLTAPYMHDGRFATLEQVVEFYNSGVVNHPNLSPPLRNPPGQPPGVRRLNLSAAQKAALVAFLKTLTDPSIATNDKFSDPFNYGD